jgi:Mrp family chromosome partitioning ATPase
MAKSVLERVQSLYAKDASMTRILSADALLPKEYTDKDGVPLPDTNPIRQLTGLPCLPFNKIVQVMGKPDTGKSTTASEIMAYAQRAGFEVILLDSEDKFDVTRFAREFKGDPKTLHVIKTNEIRKGGQL